MSSTDTDLLESALEKTAGVIAGVRPEQAHLPTPCTDFDVARVVDHMVGWAGSFAARLSGEPVDADPNDYRAGPDPAAEFRIAARSIVRAYREGGAAAGGLPVGVPLIEFVAHGWDLATATGQPVTYTSAEADRALDAGRQMLEPAYRGPGKKFGYEADVSPTAGPVEQLVAFLGRDPGWQAVSEA